MLRGLRWAVLREWTQNHPKVVGTYPGHHPQPISQNHVFEIERLEPPLTPFDSSRRADQFGEVKFHARRLKNAKVIAQIVKRADAKSQTDAKLRTEIWPIFYRNVGKYYQWIGEESKI